MNKIIGLSFVFFFTFNIYAQLDSFLINGHTRSYLVHAPKGLTNAPLLLCLHGAKGDPIYQQNLTQFDTIADREKFIVVYPDGHYTNGSHNWDYSGEEDVVFLRALIDTMYKRYNIDLSRVYCCGFSLGGMMTYRMACSSADKIAAIVSVSGPLRNSNCAPVRPIPVMHIHGLADNTINYSNAVSTVKEWRTLEGCPDQPETIDPYPSSNPSSKVKYERWGPCKENSEVILLSVTGCDHSWPTLQNVGFNASEEIWRFLKRHSLNDTPIRFLNRNSAKKLSPIFPTYGLILPPDVEEVIVFNLKGGIVDRWQKKSSEKESTNLVAKYTCLRKFKGLFLLKVITKDGKGSISQVVTFIW